MFFWSSFFLFCTLICCCRAASAPLCTGGLYTINVIDCFDSTPLYNLTFNVDVKIDKSNATFPNQVTFSNYASWSLNDSLNYLDTFWFEAMLFQQICPSFDQSCIFNVFDASGTSGYTLTIDGISRRFGNGFTLFINNGTLHDDDTGTLFDAKNYPCQLSEWNICRILTFDISESFCCTTYASNDVPDISNNDPCQEFMTTAEFLDNNDQSLLSFSANHSLAARFFDVAVTTFTTSDSSFIYYCELESMYITCEGNSTSSFSHCLLKLPQLDFQADLTCAFLSNNQSAVAILSQFSRRNNIFYKDDNVLFTPTDPCWQKTTPTFGGTKVKTSFCCTQFQSGTPITIASSTTTMVPSSSTSMVTDIPSNNQSSTASLITVSSTITTPTPSSNIRSSYSNFLLLVSIVCSLIFA